MITEGYNYIAPAIKVKKLTKRVRTTEKDELAQKIADLDVKILNKMGIYTGNKYGGIYKEKTTKYGLKRIVEQEEKLYRDYNPEIHEQKPTDRQIKFAKYLLGQDSDISDDMLMKLTKRQISDLISILKEAEDQICSLLDIKSEARINDDTKCFQSCEREIQEWTDLSTDAISFYKSKMC